MKFRKMFLRQYTGFKEIIFHLQSRGGNVLPVNSKQVGDYAVVPLTGWVVNRTVQDVVTDFWLVIYILHYYSFTYWLVFVCNNTVYFMIGTVSLS